MPAGPRAVLDRARVRRSSAAGAGGTERAGLLGNGGRWEGGWGVEGWGVRSARGRGCGSGIADPGGGVTDPGRGVMAVCGHRAGGCRRIARERLERRPGAGAMPGSTRHGAVGTARSVRRGPHGEAWRGRRGTAGLARSARRARSAAAFGGRGHGSASGRGGRRRGEADSGTGPSAGHGPRPRGQRSAVSGQWRKRAVARSACSGKSPAVGPPHRRARGVPAGRAASWVRASAWIFRTTSSCPWPYGCCPRSR